MSLNEVVFNRNKSGLGAPLLDKDHISGLVFYNETLPAGFTPEENIKKIFSLEQAEDLGIKDDITAQAVEHYHISEFFQKNPKGELWVSYFPVPSESITFDEVQTVQEFANGEIRQMGVFYVNEPFDPLELQAIQSTVNILRTNHMPLNVIYAGDISGVELSELIDLRLSNSENVSVTIGQSGNGKGAELYASTEKSVSDLGAKLGSISFAKVSDSISHVEKFPMVTASTEFDEPAFSNGVLVRSVPRSQVQSIDNLGYLFLIKIVGYGGTFNNDSYTATATTNDLATIENNRTIDKAIRQVRTRLVPKLGSPIFVNADGTLTFDTISVFKGLSDQALAQMAANRELSAFQTLINPQQDVLATGELTITLELVPVGVARSIIVNIGFVPQINS
ncbi:MAG: DUF2586 family protein [Deltaproteobacteria bacterium]|nr:DUF2586 family protein [Deltaproteobacteria bacterium]